MKSLGLRCQTSTLDPCLFFVFRKGGRAVGVFTAHIGDNLWAWRGRHLGQDAYIFEATGVGITGLGITGVALCACGYVLSAVRKFLGNP